MKNLITLLGSFIILMSIFLVYISVQNTYIEIIRTEKAFQIADYNLIENSEMIIDEKSVIEIIKKEKELKKIHVNAFIEEADDMVKIKYKATVNFDNPFKVSGLWGNRKPSMKYHIYRTINVKKG